MTKLKNKIFDIFVPVSIKFSIVTNFIVGTLFITLIALGVQYHYGQKLVETTVEESFNKISIHVSDRLKSIDNRIIDLITTHKFNPVMKKKPIVGRKHRALEVFTSTIKRNPSIYAMYLGYDNGGFYEVINMKSSDTLHEKYDVEENVVWTIIKILDRNSSVRYLEFLDKDLNIVSSKYEQSSYDPRSRPWYKDATNSKEAIKTAPYKFANLDGMGVTYGNYLGDGIVLAIDISLATMSDFLERQKITENSSLFLLDERKELLFYTSNFTQERLERFVSSHPQLDKVDEKFQPYKDGCSECISKVIEINVKGDTTEYLGMIVPKDEILAPYQEKLLYALYISLVVLLLAVPYIYWTSIMIIRPVKKLIKENEKVKNRQYSQVEEVKTMFKEIDDFAKSFISLSEEIETNEYSQRVLMDSFFMTLASVLDAKSSYSGSHSQRVASLTDLMAKEISQSKLEKFKDFHIDNQDQRRELRTGAILHDCGKVVTPEYVIDKSTKLETIYNRIHEIRTRFEVLHRDLHIEYLENKISKEELNKRQKELQEDFSFIASVNMGGEFLDDKKIERVKEIGSKKWTRYFDKSLGLSIVESLRYRETTVTPKEENLLSDDKEHLVERDGFDMKSYEQYGFKVPVPEFKFNLGEIYNLCVQKGTLTEEERFIINEHVMMTINILESLPFPEDLLNVSEYAGGHHECLDGSGYPRQLTEKDISIPSRIIAIADIFEALTAPDRPYKTPMKLSQALNIIYYHVRDGKLDKDIFRLFLSSGAYLEYGKKHLKEEQLDEINVEELLSKL
ncbi:MAG: HD domain-containing protein [Campylobacterales bacterium]|nr:HD domain-containing protein [Campylobacterales bacterium]